MATAVDMTAEEAGAAMVVKKNRLKLPMEDVVDLSDAINHLGNNSAANSGSILEVVSRVGSLADVSGVAAPEIAALASAFVAASKSPEVAATGMQNFLLALTAGKAATTTQRGIFKELGIEAETLAERMQVDAKGAIADVVTALGELDEAEQAASLSQLFGRESIDAIAPLLANPEMLQQAFDLVADGTERAGSMLAEYETRAATTANNWHLTQNSVEALAISLGTNLLPIVNRLLDGALKFLNTFRAAGKVAGDWVRDFTARFEGMDMYEIGAELIRSLGRGMWSVLTGLVDEIQAKLAGIVPAWMQSAYSWARGEDAAAGDAPGRAIGGPVRAHGIYRWMEEGVEMFSPATDGRVVPAREVAALRGAGGSGGTITMGDLHVHAAPGQSPEEIAREVWRKLKRELAGGVPLHDGGAYA